MFVKRMARKLKVADPGAAPRVPLTQDRVLRAAIALADEDGIESLSMRRLGRALGVEAMSLYNHVADKEAILGGLIELVLSEIEPPSPAEEWEVAVRRFAISAHRALLSHPWASNLVLTSRGGAVAQKARMLYIESLLGRLREAGFSPELTYHAYHALDSHILGFTVWEIGHEVAADPSGGAAIANFVRSLSRDDFPNLIEHAEQHFGESVVDGDGEFEFGLDLLLDGLRKLRDNS